MEKRKLGASGLELSLVGLGTNNFGGRIIAAHGINCNTDHFSPSILFEI